MCMTSKETSEEEEVMILINSSNSDLDVNHKPRAMHGNIVRS